MDFVVKQGVVERRGIVSFIGNIMNRIVDFMFVDEKCNNDVVVMLPKSILHRTQLICEYVSSEKGYDFSLENFLMLLYYDFIRESISQASPEKIYKYIKRNTFEQEFITIAYGDYRETFLRNDIDSVSITIEMGDDDIKKGELILTELNDVFGCNISIGELISSIWINFIEDYRNGTTKKAYKTIVKILNDVFKN